MLIDEGNCKEVPEDQFDSAQKAEDNQRIIGSPSDGAPNCACSPESGELANHSIKFFSRENWFSFDARKFQFEGGARQNPLRVQICALTGFSLCMGLVCILRSIFCLINKSDHGGARFWIIQNGLITVLLCTNATFWLKMPQWSIRRHSFHQISMAILLLLYIPFFMNEPTNISTTFTAINFNIFVLEIVLASFAAVNKAQAVTVLTVVTLV